MTKLSDEQVRELVREAMREGTRAHWTKLRAETARQPHRQKAERAFGGEVVSDLYRVAVRAKNEHTLGAIAAEIALVKKNARGVAQHMKAALALVEEAAQGADFSDRSAWRHLEGVLESALVAATAIGKAPDTYSKDVKLPKRSRGQPTIRAGFVRLATARLGGSVWSAADWAHLGIAVGVDAAPASESKFRQMTEDYRRLLRNPRR